MKILIVDDEPLARERLCLILADLEPDAKTFSAENGLKALEIINTEALDVVLLDIRMPGMDGIEAAFHISKHPEPPAVIFTTAHQDHAIQAFEASAVDYLLKPVRQERLQAALSRATLLNQGRLAKLRESEVGQSSRQHLSSNYRGKLELIPVEEIAFMMAEQKYITIGWKGSERLIEESLKSLEKEFGQRFLRVHRNALVATAHITGMEKSGADQHVIRVRDFERGITVSRRHLQTVRAFIKNKN